MATDVKNFTVESTAMTILKTITGAYDTFMESGDSKVTPWLFMNEPEIIVGLVVVYLLFVKLIGPALMKDKEPFDLRMMMTLYNGVLVFTYSYFLIDALPILWTLISKDICLMKNVDDQTALRIAELGWWFFLLKIVELADTVFFILRKKFDHVSALHVTHHSLLPILCWIGLRLEPVGHHYFAPTFNSFIHILMYTYYTLSTFGPSVQKYLWWKKYLTTLQIAQFISIMIYGCVLAASDCEISRWTIFLTLFTSILFLVFFINFFKNAYLKKKRASTKVD